MNAYNNRDMETEQQSEEDIVRYHINDHMDTSIEPFEITVESTDSVFDSSGMLDMPNRIIRYNSYEESGLYTVNKLNMDLYNTKPQCIN